MEINLFGSKSTGLNFNHIKKNASTETSKLVFDQSKEEQPSQVDT